MNTTSMMTSEEAADRVAEHIEDRLEQWEEELQPAGVSPFQCEQCGGQMFEVIQTWTEAAEAVEITPCMCGHDSDASERSITYVRHATSYGQLDDEHVTIDAEVEYDNEAPEYEPSEVFCWACYANCDDPDAIHHAETEPWAITEDGVSTQVRCQCCGHEIEFGWARWDSDQICPVESFDFDPRDAVPDEQFEETWNRRGWSTPSAV